MKIIISPFSRDIKKGKHPKNYPVSKWKELIEMLKRDNHYVIQIGVSGEEILTDHLFDLKPSRLVELIQDMDIFISVDNFFPHLVHHYYDKYKKHGIVIFSRSDPKIFGYPENINILKNGKYLRDNQFLFWDQSEYIEDAFAEPSEIMRHITEISTE